MPSPDRRRSTPREGAKSPASRPNRFMRGEGGTVPAAAPRVSFAVPQAPPRLRPTGSLGPAGAVAGGIHHQSEPLPSLGRPRSPWPLWAAGNGQLDPYQHQPVVVEPPLPTSARLTSSTSFPSASNPLYGRFVVVPQGWVFTPTRRFEEWRRAASGASPPGDLWRNPLRQREREEEERAGVARLASFGGLQDQRAEALDEIPPVRRHERSRPVVVEDRASFVPVTNLEPLATPQQATGLLRSVRRQFSRRFPGVANNDDQQPQGLVHRLHGAVSRLSSRHPSHYRREEVLNPNPRAQTPNLFNRLQRGVSVRLQSRQSTRVPSWRTETGPSLLPRPNDTSPVQQDGEASIRVDRTRTTNSTTLVQSSTPTLQPRVGTDDVSTVEYHDEAFIGTDSQDMEEYPVYDDSPEDPHDQAFNYGPQPRSRAASFGNFLHRATTIRDRLPSRMSLRGPSRLTRAASRMSNMRVASRMSNMGPKTIRVALIGDTYVGKTTLLSRLFTDTYVPTEGPSQHWTAKDQTFTVSNTPINLEAWDIPGAPPANSPDALGMAFFHAAIICIDLENTYHTDISASLPLHLNSLRNALVEAPIFVVGLKKDARPGFPTLRLTWLNEGSPIAKDTAERMARRIGAVEYLECSAKTGENVKQVFETVIEYVLQRRDEHDQRRRTASGRFGRRLSRMFGRDE